MLIRHGHQSASRGGGTGAGVAITLADLLPPGLAARLDGLDIKSTRIFAGKLQGERRSKRRGRSVEFDDFRPYVAGDDLRHIDWNVYARLDRFFLKLFQEEEDLTVHVVIDASASMLAGQPSKLFAAARLAVALSYVALINNNRLLVSAIGLPGCENEAGTPVGPGGLVRLEPLRGRSSTQRAADFALRVLSASGDAPSGAGRTTDFAEALRAIAASRSGRGVMVVISDLLIPGPGDGYAGGLRYLAGDGMFETFVFQVLSPGELDPAAEAPLGSGSSQSPVWGDLRLLDAESGAGREVTVTAELLKRYRLAASKFVSEASAWCRARGIEHALITSDQDAETTVVDAMRKVGLLR